MLFWLAKTLKIIAAWIDLILVSILLWLLAWLPRKWRGDWYFSLYQHWNWSFIRALGIEIRVLQQHAQPLPEQYLVISNHPSAFEDLGIPALFKVRALAKKELGNWFVLGRIAKAVDTIFVSREDKDSRRQASALMEERLRRGDSLAIFPEGGCYGRRLRDRFLYGAFDLSLKTGVPILPVFIHYEAQEDFEWMDQSLPEKIWEMIRAVNPRVNFYVFDAINPADFTTPAEYCDAVYAQYLGWQQKYLE